MKNMDDTNQGSPIPVEHEEGFAPRLNEMSKKFISDCVAEKERIGSDFPLAAMLIDEAIDRVQSTGRIPGRDMHANVFKQKPMKISQKVFVPVKQFPKFNFNGKILGPKGNSLRRLQEETMCKICIKGRNSMRGSAKEDELRESGDPRHAHLHKDLYVEISTVAPPAEAYARVAYALAEIRKYLIPDKNDEVSQNQLKEILADPESAHKAAQFAARLNGRSSIRGFKNATNGVSILQKITGQTYETRDDDNDAPEHDRNTDYESKSRGYNSFTPTYARVAYALAEIRKYLIPDKNDEVSQNQLKEILADPESAHKAAQFAARLNGRSSIRGFKNATNGVSILQKITGQTYETRDDDNDAPEHDRNTDYESKSRGYNSFTPMRQTLQRIPMKRPPPQQQPQQQRYQKRPRESTSNGSSKSSPFAFFHKYQ